MSDEASRLRAFVGANVLDVVSTTAGIAAHMGTVAEGNPLVGRLLRLGYDYALTSGTGDATAWVAMTVAPWVAVKVAVVAAVCVALWFSRETPGWRPFVSLIVYATVAVSLANVGALL
jgi:hypothetical protein